MVRRMVFYEDQKKKMKRKTLNSDLTDDEIKKNLGFQLDNNQLSKKSRSNKLKWEWNKTVIEIVAFILISCVITTSPLLLFIIHVVF